MAGASILFNTTPTPLDEGVPAIRLTELSRSFGPVQALSGVSLDVRVGEITALLGENGAGKSTLLKILAGLQKPSSGTLAVAGAMVSVFDPGVMLKSFGIALVPQELALANDRSIAHNITMGNEPGGRLFPNRRAMEATAASMLSDLGVDLDPRIEVGRLNLATRQLVVVARSVARRCRVLILDEPTAMLTPSESERLFQLITRLQALGVTIIYVSHRMPEVFALSDQVHVLRDGRHVASMRTDETNEDEVVAAMVGRQLGETIKHTSSHREEDSARTVALQVEALSGRSHTDVSFEVHRGEIVGIAGLPDSGRVEVLRNIFGADPARSGAVYVDNSEYRNRTPPRSIARRVGYLPGERREQGLLLSGSVADNIGVLTLDRFTRFGLVNKGAMRREAEKRSKAMSVRAASSAQSIQSLSGGNQQKAILARWLSIDPQVLILDEPTRGVDVGAKADIYEKLVRLADAGVGILCSSSDLPELLAICDRIAVMREGKLAAILPGPTATEEAIMAIATGSGLSGSPATESSETKSGDKE